MTDKRYDLIDRTIKFTGQIVFFCKQLPRTSANIEYTQQLIRAAGAIGANYVEANDALGRKDFLMRVRIARKEAKEVLYWIQVLLSINDHSYDAPGKLLLQEATELKNILSAIIISIEKKIQKP